MTRMLRRALFPVFLIIVLCADPCSSQLLPEWIVSGGGQFTALSTVKGISGCPGGCYLTGGQSENDYVLQVSEDAGRSWIEVLRLKRYGFGAVQSPLSRPFLEVQVNTVLRPTAAVCFAYGCGSYELNGAYFPFLLRSLDSGRTWNEIALADSGQGIFSSSLAMKDSQYGIRRGGYVDAQHSVMYRTSDGGLTWSTVDVPFRDYRVLDIFYADDGALFVTENQSPAALYRSMDDGATWEYRGPLPASRTPCFVSADLGWIAYGESNGIGSQEKDVIARTTDGGSSWTTIRDTLQEPAFGLIAIAAADAEHVIAVGRLGKSLHSTDGGATWETGTRPFYLYDPATVEVEYPDTASAVSGALMHIMTYTGKRNLPAPTLTVKQGMDVMQPVAHWTTVNGAVEYQLEMAEDYHTNTMQFEIFDEDPYMQSGWLADTTLALNFWLRENRDYFVRVRARGGAYTSDWSYPEKFYTQQSTGIPPVSLPSRLTLSVSPHPAGDVANVTVRGMRAGENWTMTLHDAQGRTCRSDGGVAASDGILLRELRAGGLANGMYYIHFACGGEYEVFPLHIVR